MAVKHKQSLSLNKIFLIKATADLKYHLLAQNIFVVNAVLSVLKVSKRLVESQLKLIGSAGQRCGCCLARFLSKVSCIAVSIACTIADPVP